jgi:hypothetical protein
VLLVQLLDRVEDAKPGAHRALGVVLVRDRGAEDGHDRVADELLHRAAVPLDLLLHALVVRPKRRAHVLRVSAIGAVREAHEVDEEDRDDLALLSGPRRLGERGPAGETEARAIRVLLAT